MLRTMKKAVYSAEQAGHYALATSSYTHFTSPIRRYPDLIVHRLLRKLGRGEELSEDLSEDRLEDVAEHSSITERRADDAERELVDWKKVRFMANKVGDVFEGIVSGVTGFGIYVELLDYLVEGLVHISTLADDYYHYNEDAHTLTGESTGRMFRLGGRDQGPASACEPHRSPARFRHRGPRAAGTLAASHASSMNIMML